VRNTTTTRGLIKLVSIWPIGGCSPFIAVFVGLRLSGERSYICALITTSIQLEQQADELVGYEHGKSPVLLVLLVHFLFVPCGRLSWLSVSFLLHVKIHNIVSYRIVSAAKTFVATGARTFKSVNCQHNLMSQLAHYVLSLEFINSLNFAVLF